jgi:hypothetical protein
MAGRGQNFGPDILRTAHVTVGATATLIRDKESGRLRLDIVLLEDGKDLFIGDETVTTTTGHLVVQGKGMSHSTEYTGAVYGVVESGTLGVSYAESAYF